MCIRDSGNSANLRVNIMRATSELNIIYLYVKDNRVYIQFASTNIDPKFMNGCDEEMKDTAFECLTCSMDEKCDDKKDDNKNILICKSCLIACHNGHQIEMKSVQYELEKKSVRCVCKNTNCIFLK